MKSVTLIADYQVANGPVTLTIVIGDAQIGASIVKLDAVVLGKGQIAKLLIGNGADIRNHALRIKSVVSDVNDATNNTSITYQLRGGAQDQDFHSKCTVATNGDSVIYRAEFRLI